MGGSDRAGGGVDLGAAARAAVELHRTAPGAVAGAAQRGPGGWRHGRGVAGRLYTVAPSGAPAVSPAMEVGTLFDLASVSKPVVALVLARLARAGVVSRDLPLGACLAGVAAGPLSAVSLDTLSAHRSGLEGHRELYRAEAGAAQLARAELLRAAARAVRPECRGDAPPGGFLPVYSDLGYMLLGAALAARAGVPLDELVETEVARPLGLRLGSARRLAPRGFAQGAVAPTELVPWRGGVLSGVVHDENAFVLEGRGAAGHAGLFGDCAAVVGLGVAVLDALAGRRPEWLGPGDLEPLVRRRPGGSLCAGFDRRSGDDPQSGRHFGPETFGHLGFTGTSIWLDPEQELVGVLLMNRVHPSRLGAAEGADASAQSDRPPVVGRARRAAYDALFLAMSAAAA
ncbi:MAG: serine hydrolase [Myxococcales bacterium]|nr:serine hydrolase [Myxococcales bacterium]